MAAFFSLTNKRSKVIIEIINWNLFSYVSGVSSEAHSNHERFIITRNNGNCLKKKGNFEIRMLSLHCKK